MSSEIKDYSVHLVGLGGAGVNIVETFLRYPGIHDYLQRRGVKVSLLALDVADHDILSLQVAYDKFVAEMKAKNIPSDKVGIIAKSVKFTTPEAMFEFIERFPEFLKLEEARIPEKYTPWLMSSLDIPPLSGGVGRRRALSKAIYGLNYYYLKLVDGMIENFKENVSTATLQPIIYVIFGLGGGTGSGAAVDFVRHLRHKMGSAFPIIGLAVLPCQGDDPLARGSSAFASINEIELLASKEKNRVISKYFGRSYENPFTAFFFMPLGPPYGRTGNLAETKMLVDEAIADTLVNSVRFDLSDLLNNIGCNLALGDRWVHTINTLRITYPINEHVEIAKLYLSMLDKQRILRQARIEMYIGDAQAHVGGMAKIIEYCRGEIVEILKKLFVEKNIYDEKTFDQKIQTRIYEDKSFEMNLSMQIKGIDESLKSSLNDVATPVKTIGVHEPEGTTEARIRKLVDEIVSATRNITRTHEGYHSFAERMIDDLNTSVAGSQKLTSKEKILLNDLADYVRLVDTYLNVLRSLLETRVLAESLTRELSESEKTDFHTSALSAVQKMLNPELSVTFTILSGLFSPQTTQIKTLDTNLTNIRMARRVLSGDLEKFRAAVELAETKIRSLQSEKERIARDRARIRAPWSAKKSVLDQKLREIEQDIIKAKAEMEDASAGLQKFTSKINEYQALEKKFDVNSDYRRTLGEAVGLANKHYEKLNELTKDRGYFDRVAEIGEDERLKILQRIIADEEASLTRENILREIVDRRRLNDYLVSVLKLLRIPSSLGMSVKYRTDYMWVTVVAPRGVWDQDLTSELKAALSGYIQGDSSRSITVREIESKDPWTLRFLVFSCKARVEDLEVWEGMKSLYNQTERGDKVLAHSFLLEQGVLATKDLPDDLTRQKEEKVIR